MYKEKIINILQQVKAGEVNLEQALGILQHLPYEDLHFANLDHHRGLRRGFPEVIFCKGKSHQQIKDIFIHLAESGNNVLATRANPEIAKVIITMYPQATYYPDSRIIELINKEPEICGRGTILVISAGTADIPIAEEAAVTARLMGNKVEEVYDVGVAGIHRLLDRHDQIMAAEVVIVVAGMEGALASVVGGMVNAPVIAVPTSVGYGASFQGLAPLLGMLNSCSAGVVVVNIDNGFGAGYAASLMNREKDK